MSWKFAAIVAWLSLAVAFAWMQSRGLRETVDRCINALQAIVRVP
jgi:hypothetical protein